jgi:hypothetical protein
VHVRFWAVSGSRERPLPQPKADITLTAEEGNNSSKGRVYFQQCVLLANLMSAQSVFVLSAGRLFCCAADLVNEPIVRIGTYVAAQCGFAASNFGHAFAGSPKKYLPKEYRITRVAPLHTYHMLCNKH